MGIHSNKNFIKTNAIENIMALPKKPRPTYADTKKGDKQLLESSGLVPKYVKKKVRDVGGKIVLPPDVTVLYLCVILLYTQCQILHLF